MEGDMEAPPSPFRTLAEPSLLVRVSERKGKCSREKNSFSSLANHTYHDGSDRRNVLAFRMHGVLSVLPAFLPRYLTYLATSEVVPREACVLDVQS